MATAASRDLRLSPLDASFLYYEVPNQPLHVGAVALLEGTVDFAALQAMLAERLGRLPLYRQHPERTLLDLTAPRWVDDLPFEPHRHVHHVRVAAPGDDAALHATIDGLFATPIDLTSSPWETWLIDGLADGRAAILSKVHHCMVDGVSGAQVLEVMTDGAPDGSEAAPPPPRPSTVAVTTNGVPVMPFGPARALATVRDAAQAVGTMGSLMSGPLKPLPFNGPLSANRHIVWARFELDEILALRGAAGCKVNDIVLAIISGAVRRHLADRGADVDTLHARTLIPVSMRTADEHLALGNRVSAMFLSLPIHIREPLARLHAIAGETRRLKAAGQPQAFGLAMSLASALPSAIGPVFASLATRFPMVNTVCTNVPGPRGTRWVLGRRVVDVHPLVPLAMDIGLGFAILSYDRALSICATADPGLVPGADAIADGLRAAADELHGLFGTRRAARVPAPPRPAVRELMAHELVTARPGTTLADAWRTMHACRIRHLPIVDDDGRLTGLVTERDVLAAAQSRVIFPDEDDRVRMLAWARVDDVMETHLCTVAPDAPAAEAGDRMAALKIGCLPVLDGGELVGLVTEHDFLRWATDHMERPLA